MKKLLLSAIALGLFSTLCVAETADQNKPITVQADTFMADEIKQKATYRGRVDVRQGTLHMTGNQLDLSENAKGYKKMVLTGKLATFRQRRDAKVPGVEEWIYGEAQTITYDETNGHVTLKKDAKVQRLENGVVKDQTQGSEIVYDTYRSRTIIKGSKDGRASTVIAPRKKTEPAKNHTATPKLNSASTIVLPRQ